MSSLLERGRRGEPLTDLGIVDMHGHLGRTSFAIPDLSPASLVAAMDRIGVRTVVCSHIMCLAAGACRANDDVLEAMRAHPGRILGYVRLWPASAAEVRAETEACLRQGFIGVKLHNTIGFDYTDAAYVPALEMANERRMPVLLHTWAKKEEFEQVRVLAERYPEASLVLGHSGVNNSVDDYGRLAREWANVHLELCMSLTPRGHVERLVAAAGVDKVVWGSDAIFLNMAHQVGKVLGARLPDEDKVRILATNARRLLDRVTPKP